MMLIMVMVMVNHGLFFVNVNAAIGEFDSNSLDNKHLENVIQRGKNEMENMKRLLQMSGMPKQQNCWKSALENLEVSCKNLNEDVQSRLAFTFTTCFTDMTGQGSYICEDKNDIKDCFRSLNPVVMQIYHSYFLHTQDMCYYLQHQIWQEKTETAVNHLTTAAVDVAKTMEDSKDTQARILESQKESAKVQTDLLKDNSLLYKNIQGVKQIFDEFKVSTDEHRLIFYEIFDKLTRMQNLVSWIHGEMSFFDLLGFYVLCMIFGFFATSTQRTHQARFFLIILLLVSLAAERYAFAYLSESDRRYLPEEVQTYIWIIRKGAVIIGVFTIIIAAARYRDIQIMNNSLLSHLHNRMDMLTELIEAGTKLSAAPTPTISREIAFERESSEDFSDGSESSFSTYSTENDEDYVPPEESELHKKENRGAEFTLGDIPDDSLAHQSVYNGLFSVKVPGFSRIRTPLSSTVRESHQYSLRERRVRTQDNEILEKETPTEFAKAIRIMTRNRRKLFEHNGQQEQNSRSAFSDDE